MSIHVRRSPDGRRVAIDLRTIPDANWPGPIPEDQPSWFEVKVPHGVTVQLLTDEDVADWVES